MKTTRLYTHHKTGLICEEAVWTFYGIQFWTKKLGLSRSYYISRVFNPAYKRVGENHDET